MGLNLKEVEAVVNKLLDKAGTDERLTPRLLRQKVEQKMKIEPDSLLPVKANILKMISDWWDKNFPEKNGASGQPPLPSSVESLSKFARAVGKGPQFFKTLNHNSDEEKALDILKRFDRCFSYPCYENRFSDTWIKEVTNPYPRLQEEGYEVSQTPSAEEIEKAKKEHELKKELSDIDTSLILKRDRRSAEVDSNAGDDTTIEDSSDKINSADGDPALVSREQSSLSPVLKKVKQSKEEADEEEAEF